MHIERLGKCISSKDCSTGVETVSNSTTWELVLFQEQASRKNTAALKSRLTAAWEAVLARSGRSGAAQMLPASQCAFLHASALALPPFHMLPLEYPPLTLVIFSLSLLAPLPYYQLVFAMWMALTSVLIYWLLLRFGPRGAALTFALFALVGAWATAEGRFDLVPAALTLLCVLAAERKHWTAAYIALAFGTLLKIYPLLGHWRWKNSLVFFGILIGVTALFALLDFQGAVVSQLSYFAHRPVQIESSGSTILWIAAQFGHPAHVEFTFGSLNIVSALGNSVSLFFLAAFVLGYLYVTWLQWRGKLDLVQSFIALLLVFMATGKVFSPQYLIWLMPLLAYSNALDGFWLLFWGSISLLTTIIYPYLYTRTPNILAVQFVPGFVQAVAVRDALFVLVTLAYLFNWFQVRKRKALPAEPVGKATRPLLES